MDPNLLISSDRLFLRSGNESSYVAWEADGIHTYNNEYMTCLELQENSVLLGTSQRGERLHIHPDTIHTQTVDQGYNFQAQDEHLRLTTNTNVFHQETTTQGRHVLESNTNSFDWQAVGGYQSIQGELRRVCIQSHGEQQFEVLARTQNVQLIQNPDHIMIRVSRSDIQIHTAGDNSVLEVFRQHAIVGFSVDSVYLECSRHHHIHERSPGGALAQTHSDRFVVESLGDDCP